MKSVTKSGFGQTSSVRNNENSLCRRFHASLFPQSAIPFGETGILSRRDRHSEVASQVELAVLLLLLAAQRKAWLGEQGHYIRGPPRYRDARTGACIARGPSLFGNARELIFPSSGAD